MFLTKAIFILCLSEEKHFCETKRNILFYDTPHFPKFYEHEVRNYYFSSPKNKFIYFYKGGTIILFKLFFIYMFCLFIIYKYVDLNMRVPITKI